MKINNKNTGKLPSYIGGLFAIVAGVFFILYPEVSSNVIGLMLGIILFVAGLSEVIGYVLTIKQFREENYGKAAGAEIVLVYSIVIMALGVYFIIKPAIVLQILSTVVGLFFLIDGIVKLRRELFLINVKDINCWVIIIMSVLLIVVGVLLLLNVFYGTRNVIVFSGLAFIISGVETCCIGLIKRREK